jgi:hypothetical protein
MVLAALIGTIAIRLLAEGEFGGDGNADGGRAELEMVRFLTVTDNRFSEFPIVTELSVFNRMRESSGLPPLQ